MTCKNDNKYMTKYENLINIKNSIPKNKINVKELTIHGKRLALKRIQKHKNKRKYMTKYFL